MNRLETERHDAPVRIVQWFEAPREQILDVWVQKEYVHAGSARRAGELSRGG